MGILLFFIVLVLPAIGILYLWDKKNPERSKKKFVDIDSTAKSVGISKTSISNYLRIPNDAPHSWLIFLIGFLILDTFQKVYTQEDIIKNIIEIVHWIASLALLIQLVANFMRFIKKRQSK